MIWFSWDITVCNLIIIIPLSLHLPQYLKRKSHLGIETFFFPHEHKLWWQLSFKWSNKSDYQKKTISQNFLSKVKYKYAVYSYCISSKYAFTPYKGLSAKWVAPPPTPLTMDMRKLCFYYHFFNNFLSFNTAESVQVKSFLISTPLLPIRTPPFCPIIWTAHRHLFKEIQY